MIEGIGLFGMGVLAVGMALMTRGGKKPPVSFDDKADPRHRAARAKLGELHGRQEQIEHGSDERTQEILDVAAEIDALEVKRLLGEVPEAELATLRATRRRLDDERRDLLESVPRLGLAIGEQETRLHALEGEIQHELRPALLAAHKAAAEDLAEKLRAAADANARLQTIAAEATWANLPVSFLPSLVLVDSDRGDVYLKHPDGQSEVSRWFRDARAGGYNVGAPQHDRVRRESVSA